MKRKLIRILTILVIGSLALAIGFKVFKPPANNEYTTQTILKQGETDLLTKDIIIDSVKEVSEINVLEIESTKVAKLTKGEFLGSKSKEIKFKAITKYYIDLSQITGENVMIFDNNKIVLFLSEPLTNTYIDTESTVHLETSNKWLSFGDLKITVEEYTLIQNEVINQVKSEVNTEENNLKAKDNIKATLESALLNLTNNKYKIEINYIK